MVSLQLKSKDVKDVMEHVYLCLGKESLSYQDLVFFIAYDLKLMAPSVVEKMIGAAENQNLLSISQDKIVTFDVKALSEGNASAKPSKSLPEMVKDLTLDAILNKAMTIKPDHIVSAGYDGDASAYSAEFSGPGGNSLTLSIDEPNKVVTQEYDESVSAYKGKKLFLKYLVRLVSLKKDDADLARLITEIHDNPKAWTFEFKQVEK
jgi:hypothetical protein